MPIVGIMLSSLSLDNLLIKVVLPTFESPNKFIQFLVKNSNSARQHSLNKANIKKF